jgi:hypothetical protein
LRVVANEDLPETQEIGICANKLGALVEQSVSINDILAKKIAKLQKLVHRGAIAKILLDPLKECNLI